MNISVLFLALSGLFYLAYLSIYLNYEELRLRRIKVPDKVRGKLNSTNYFFFLMLEACCFWDG